MKGPGTTRSRVGTSGTETTNTRKTLTGLDDDASYLVSWSAEEEIYLPTKPSRMGAPTVTSADTALEVTWDEPTSNGGSSLTGYHVRHKLASAPDEERSWTDHGLDAPWRSGKRPSIGTVSAIARLQPHV